MSKHSIPGFSEAEKQAAFRTGEANWPVGEAKSRFSELVASTAAGPQKITRNGKAVAVVVSLEEWLRRTRPSENIVDFLLNSPLRGSGLDLERVRSEPRELDL